MIVDRSRPAEPAAAHGELWALASTEPCSGDGPRRGMRPHGGATARAKVLAFPAAAARPRSGKADSPEQLDLIDWIAAQQDRQ